MSYVRTSGAGSRLRWAGLFGLIAALSFCLMPGVADAAKGKKKKDTVKVMTQNLYLGSDLADATNAGLSSRTDLFADEVGEVINEVQANDFNVRAQTIASEIKKNKADLVGLQEAAIWKLQFPTDGAGPPRGTLATTPLIDYIDTLLAALNNKARTKKQCAKKGLKGNKCYRGYRLVVAQQEADVEQFADIDNNPGPDGTTFDVSNSASLGSAAPSRWLEGNDDTGVSLGEPPALACADEKDNDGDSLVDFGADPQCAVNGDNDEATAGVQLGAAFPGDANFDSHALGSAPNGLDATGAGHDPAGVEDCAPSVPGPSDENPAEGPTLGEAGMWPFAGYDGDLDHEHDGDQVPVCMFHGIDGDARLQMQDAIIARKGAGVKVSNAIGANFGPGSTFSLTVFGQPLSFTRGWVAADVSVRGKKFRLVNTHLESESFGTVREDQARDLVQPGGPATVTPTVLVGDLNSDPTREPTNLPNGDGGSKIAIDRLFAAGFTPLSGPGATGGHGELLSDLGDLLGEGRIDHILTNSPAITLASTLVLDGQGGGLWASDHGGVLSRLRVPGGKKKK